MWHVHATFFREPPSRGYADAKKMRGNWAFYWWAL
jgi:hypothetical protein